ncbi:AcrR family transcriptional regulator [Saccharopolyspora gloriosae]|uniref:AcrR family transcriptional regulator n=1 Tax=Saccharopolyspora gloriosae TaxID=455344 RepID=A0A840N814_9PSEU|nr:TetR/AcrR family transcriptional regulator [Saccharopolyspora gloriosae]MBB5067774.1 AcrR family transcriptional regulator [Saccharopolyspora gloriosae]
MAGRKQFDVDVALDGAMHVFWEHGYAEASLSRLLAATGLGRGSLYSTFGSKEQLFRLSLHRYAELFGSRLSHALRAHPDDPVAAIRAFYDAVLERLAEPEVPAGCLITRLAAETAELDDPVRDAVGNALDGQRAEVRAALRPAEGTSSVTELDDLALYVSAVNQSLTVLHLAGTPLADLRTVADMAHSHVAAALRT